MIKTAEEVAEILKTIEKHWSETFNGPVDWCLCMFTLEKALDERKKKFVLDHLDHLASDGLSQMIEAIKKVHSERPTKQESAAQERRPGTGAAPVQAKKRP
jgi:hypothetical protein